MLPYRYHATVVFMVVAGEEQGLLGATYFAEQAKTANWQIESMLTNDIIGSSLGRNGVHDDRTVRVFSEGIASNETEAEARIRRSVGGEDDSPSRQLARFSKEMGERYVHGMKVMLIARRDRYLRGGDHIPFLERGYPAVRLTRGIAVLWHFLILFASILSNTASSEPLHFDGNGRCRSHNADNENRYQAVWPVVAVT